jgi:hypothetical protein
MLAEVMTPAPGGSPRERVVPEFPKARLFAVAAFSPMAKLLAWATPAVAAELNKSRPPLASA